MSLMRMASDEFLSCIRCHAKVYEYDDKFHEGQKVFWCPKCKESGVSPYSPIANISRKV